MNKLVPVLFIALFESSFLSRNRPRKTVNTIDSYTGVVGDDNPLDVCEISNHIAKCGDIKKVNPLGAFAILDEGEID